MLSIHSFSLPSELVNQLIYLIFTALLAALTSAIGLGLHKFNAYVNARIGPANLDYLKGLSATIVRALEQSPAYRDFDGTQKKEAAILQLVELAAKYGIPVSQETISSLIEEEVQRMNAEVSDLGPFTPLPAS